MSFVRLRSFFGAPRVSLWFALWFRWRRESAFRLTRVNALKLDEIADLDDLPAVRGININPLGGD